MKHRYVRGQYFRHRWEFEDLSRDFKRNTESLNYTRISEAAFRQIHSADESEQRAHHEQNNKDFSEEKAISLKKDEDAINHLKVRSQIEHEREVEIEDI